MGRRDRARLLSRPLRAAGPRVRFKTRSLVAPAPRAAMPDYLVQGSFYARRGYWQPFTKRHEAPSEAVATEWALSEIGGCHGVKRHRIRIEKVTVAPAA